MSKRKILSLLTAVSLVAGMFAGVAAFNASAEGEPIVNYVLTDATVAEGSDQLVVDINVTGNEELGNIGGSVINVTYNAEAVAPVADPVFLTLTDETANSMVEINRGEGTIKIGIIYENGYDYVAGLVNLYSLAFDVIDAEAEAAIAVEEVETVYIKDGVVSAQAGSVYAFEVTGGEDESGETGNTALINMGLVASNIEGLVGVPAGEFVINYDADVLTPVNDGFGLTEEYEGAIIETNIIADGQLKVAFATTAPAYFVDGELPLGTIAFTINEEADAAATTVSVELIEIIFGDSEEAGAPAVIGVDGVDFTIVFETEEPGPEFSVDYGTYNVTDAYISNIAPGTTVAELKAGIAVVGGTVSVDADDNAVVATGMVVSVVDIGGQMGEDKTVVIFGDVNGDGEINATDTALVKSDAFNAADLSGVFAVAADVNGDTEVNATDTALVKSDAFNAADLDQSIVLA